MRLSYDLHIHSCLSPCGDNEMTPNNIVNMAILNGLDIIAITDHNSAGNVRSVCDIAEKNGLLAVPGLELCTAEEIHVVCLFRCIESAERFSDYVYTRLPEIKNDEKIFGEQLFMDIEDRVTGREERMLINATEIGIYEIGELMERFDGGAFPAHIDKNAYSVLSSLGSIPPECGFRCVEVKNPENYFLRAESEGEVGGRLVFTDSDAHYLWDIAEPKRFVELPACSENSLVERIRNGAGDMTGRG